MNSKELYFDTSATVPMLQEVIETIYKEMKETWGNPSSTYKPGLSAREKMELSRIKVATYLGVAPEEIIFTGSASMANNLALKGYAIPNECSLITIGTEHKSILNCGEYLWSNGYINQCYFIECDAFGQVDLTQLKKALSQCCALEETPLVSISIASSEIGSLQNIECISKLVKSYGGIFHTDATQCFTRFAISLENVDMMTVGGSKIGAGKGIGILYKKKGISLEPLIHGGNQENGLIAGTEDVPKMCGFAKALEERHYNTLEDYRIYLIKNLSRLSCKYIINGDPKNHLDNHICVSFKNKKADEVVSICSMLGLYISAGSACNAGSLEPSFALKAIKVPDEYIKGTIRITLPQDVTYEDIDRAISILEIALG